LACRSRIDATTRIKKEKKDEALKRRRGMTPITATTTAVVDNNMQNYIMSDVNTLDGTVPTDETKSILLGSKKVRLNTVDETVTMVMKRLRDATSQQSSLHANENYYRNLLDIVQDVRRIFGDNKDPPIDKLLAHGLLPCVGSLIRTQKDAKILYEAIWCLINVSSSHVSSHVEAVFASGIVPVIANLIVHHNVGVTEQAIWFIANMAGENVEYRDIILKMTKVTNGLLYHLQYPSNVSIVSTAAWAVSNLFRGQPNYLLQTDLAACCIPPLVGTLLSGVGRAKASELVDLTNALCCIVESSAEATNLVIEEGIVPVLVKSIQYYSELPETAILLIPSIKILWLIASGTQQQTDQVVQSGFVKCSLKLLESSNKGVQRHVLLTLSNIAAGTHDQINVLVQQLALVKEIVYLALHSSADVKKEALWTLSNIITQGKLRHANRLVNVGCIPTFCDFLATPNDNTLVMIVLEAIEKLLLFNQETELGYIASFEYCNGVKYIEDLQTSQNEAIYEIAVRILVNFFNGCEDDEHCADQNIAPVVLEGDTTFEFGINSLPAKQLFPENVEMEMSECKHESKTFYNFGGNVQTNTTNMRY
jgi:Atypical Arm repeat/Armadillo/beta-catenin-like repeat